MTATVSSNAALEKKILSLSHFIVLLTLHAELVGSTNHLCCENSNASCWSLTYESASDVSLFHTRFIFPPCTCRWLWLLPVFLLVLCFPVFCMCLKGVLCIPPRVLDDRQCFTGNMDAPIYTTYAMFLHDRLHAFYYAWFWMVFLTLDGVFNCIVKSALMGCIDIYIWSRL